MSSSADSKLVGSKGWPDEARLAGELCQRCQEIQGAQTIAQPVQAANGGPQLQEQVGEYDVAHQADAFKGFLALSVSVDHF